MLQRPCSRLVPIEPVLNRQGVEFSLTQLEPGLWKSQIGETVKTVKTAAKLMGLAAHRVQQRIDQEVRLARARSAARPDRAT